MITLTRGFAGGTTMHGCTGPKVSLRSRWSLAIRFNCPSCGKTLSVKDDLAGKKVKCPCGAVAVATAAATPTPVTNKPASAPHKSGAAATNPPRPASAAPPASAQPSKNATPPHKGVAPRPASGSLPPSPFANNASDLSALFDELTPMDLQTKAERTEAAAADAVAHVDPLAAFRDTKGGKKIKQRGPSVPKPVGVIVLAVLNLLIAAGMAFGGIMYLVSPETLLSGESAVMPQPSSLKIMAGLLLSGATMGAIVGIGLLSAQPWGWWVTVTYYKFSIFRQIIVSVVAIQTIGNTPYEIGRMTGGLVMGGLVFAYLYQQKSRDFFGIKIKPLVATAITLPTGLITAVASFFAFRYALRMLLSS